MFCNFCVVGKFLGEKKKEKRMKKEKAVYYKASLGVSDHRRPNWSAAAGRG